MLGDFSISNTIKICGRIALFASTAFIKRTTYYIRQDTHISQSFRQASSPYGMANIRSTEKQNYMRLNTTTNCPRQFVIHNSPKHNVATF